MANLWDPDIEFDETDARRLLSTQFPEHAAASLAPFGRGWDNRLFLMDGEWVLRFPVRHIAAPLIAHELAALPYLGPRLPLPVPDPVLAGEPDAGYPFRWMGYRRLDGEVLCRLEPMPESPEMAQQLGAFLAALHALDPEAIDLPGDVLDKTDLPARLQQLRERMERLAGGGVLEADRGRRLIELARRLATAADWDRPARIVHGDLYGYHVLSDGAAVTGVIDWGDVHRGDPALDLSIAYAWFGGAARRALFEAYGEVDDATHHRARFRALYYGPVLIGYGRDIGDAAVEATGWRALALAG